MALGHENMGIVEEVGAGRQPDQGAVAPERRMTPGFCPCRTGLPGMTKEPTCARRTGSFEAGADGGCVPAVGVLQV